MGIVYTVDRSWKVLIMGPLSLLVILMMCANVARQEEEDEVVVEVATICKGSTTKRLANLRRMVTSMLEQSSGSRIRLTILSDSESWPSANELLRKTIGHYYARGVIFGQTSSADIHIDNVDLDNLIPSVLDQRLMKTMKRIFGPSNKTLVIPPDDPRHKSYFPNIEEIARAIKLFDAALKAGITLAVGWPITFDLDLFYIAPFYHRLFPNKENLIVVDLDLEFRVGIDKVYQLFSSMSNSQVLGFVPDQTPHYPFITGATSLPRQGVNSGLVLFKLKSMRKNREYNEELTSERMESLSQRFLPNHDWYLGDQEWFSLLSWERSHLVKLLPCQFNVYRSQWLPMSSSPLFRNLPCNEKPAILHYSGNHDVFHMDLFRDKYLWKL